MKKILVTGAHGFIGKNICVAIDRTEELTAIKIGSASSPEELEAAVMDADAVMHLAGVNRPESDAEFTSGNVDFTSRLCDLLLKHGKSIPLVSTSTTQVGRDNAYGMSKEAGEKVVLSYAEQSGAKVYIYRLPNVFGKWSKPNYNTVVATFCHNVSRGLPVTISDRSAELKFAYVDDVVSLFIDRVQVGGAPTGVLEYDGALEITLGELYDTIESFKKERESSKLADFGDPMTKYLYSTYLSFLDREDYSYPVDLKTDDRGWLFELVKSDTAGQIFVSSTKPGITRGNHYHDTKVEKFCVVKGSGRIHFRHVLEDLSFSYDVDDTQIKVVDIPPGYTHSIENTGDSEMVTLFWANEIFDHDRMDTYFEKV